MMENFMNTYYGKIFIEELKSKFWIIIVVAIVCGVLVGIDKCFFSQQMIQTTTFHSEKTIRVNYSQPNKSGKEFDYQTFFNSYSEVNEFLQKTEGEFDYSQFNANWKNYTQIEKIEWIQKHVIINNIYDGTMQCIFTLAPDDPKNIEYTKAYGEQFLDEYVTFVENRLSVLLQTSTFVEVDSFTLSPQEIPVSKKKSFVKYGSVGVFLGILIGILIVMILTMRKYKK